MTGHARGLAALTVAVLAGSVLAPTSSASAATLVARTATLTAHPAGYPVAGTTAVRQVVSASVTQDVKNSRIQAQITLGAVPTAQDDADLTVALGNRDGGGICRGDEFEAMNALAPSSGASRSGAVVSLDRGNLFADISVWDCAYVATYPAGVAGPPVDVVVGDLVDVTTPEPASGPASVSLSAPELLGSTKLKLVPGVWTTLTADVATSRDLTNVVIGGSGKGLKVRPTAVSNVLAQFGREVRVVVKLTKKRASNLTLTLTAAGASAATTVKVRQTRAPAAPRPGTYRSKDGDVRFRITSGKPKVVDFYAQVGARCGTFPQYTYPTQPVAYPKVKIGRDGIVDVTLTTTGASAQFRQLTFRIAGGKVTKGQFYFAGGLCDGLEKFTARRR